MDYREKIIFPYIKNKHVLDLGVGDTSDRFLHKFIKNNALEVIGIELNKKRAEELIKKGHKIIIGNAEITKINKKFDVIIAGDLIEHLNNVGDFLENVKEHLKEDGLFIFNTPNIYSINYTLRSLFQGGDVTHFREHTMGFTEQLLKELLIRHKLKTKKTIYFSHKEKTIGSLIIRFFSSISKKWNEQILMIVGK